MNIVTALGPRHLFKMKKAHDIALGYLRGHMVSECLCALFSTGIIDDLLENRSLDVDAYAKSKNLDEKVLKAIFKYLYSVKILNRDNNGYRSSKRGRFIFNYAKGPFDFAGAYGQIFDNLEALLRRKKKYGLDIKRIDSLVAKASAETEEWIPYPVVKGLIKKYHFKGMLDLGCGSAHFLIKLCEENPDLKGYGVDISPEALGYAKEKLNSSSAKERVKLECCDIFNISSLAETWIRKIDVITCMFVLHEFIEDDGVKIFNLLNQLKRDFKDSYLIICELCEKTQEQLRTRPTLIAEHHLFHALSNQKLAGYDNWRNIFKQAKYDIVEEIKLDFAGQGYFILK